MSKRIVAARRTVRTLPTCPGRRPTVTMNSPASGSSSTSGSQSFDLLDERIRRWIWQAGWTELRDAQERAVPALLGADRDVIIAAATAAGKTEAAFFPILSNLLADG